MVACEEIQSVEATLPSDELEQHQLMLLQHCLHDHGAYEGDGDHDAGAAVGARAAA